MREFAAAALALLLAVACERSVGPAPVAWDRTRCSQCGMLVSDPGFAAQLHGADGSVRHFDDPGCLLAALAALGAGDEAQGARIWLHHHREPRWLSGFDAAFTETPHSPMGYRLGAVAAGETPGAISLDEARRRAARFDRARSPHRAAPSAHGGSAHGQSAHAESAHGGSARADSAPGAAPREAPTGGAAP